MERSEPYDYYILTCWYIIGKLVVIFYINAIRYSQGTHCNKYQSKDFGCTFSIFCLSIELYMLLYVLPNLYSTFSSSCSKGERRNVVHFNRLIRVSRLLLYSEYYILYLCVDMYVPSEVAESAVCVQFV